jgi:hypothetical protein
VERPRRPGRLTPGQKLPLLLGQHSAGQSGGGRKRQAAMKRCRPLMRRPSLDMHAYAMSPCSHHGHYSLAAPRQRLQDSGRGADTAHRARSRAARLRIVPVAKGPRTPDPTPPLPQGQPSRSSISTGATSGGLSLLNTHVAAWLFAGDVRRLSTAAAPLKRTTWWFTGRRARAAVPLRNQTCFRCCRSGC